MADDSKTQAPEPTQATAAPTAKPMEPKEDGRSDYVVTGRAGPRVAGRLVKSGDVVRLLMAEADYHLAAGEVVAKPPAAAAEKGKRG